ncbi:hypothetical protein D3C87_1853900 [compost metagenome]
MAPPQEPSLAYTGMVGARVTARPGVPAPPMSVEASVSFEDASCIFAPIFNLPSNALVRPLMRPLILS